MKTHYEVLGVSPFSEIEIIAAAYRALMRKYDANDTGEKKDVTRIQEIREAYAVLGDHSRRAEYDAFLARGHSTQLAVQAENGDQFPINGQVEHEDNRHMDHMASAYEFEKSFSEFFKNKHFFFGIAVIYVMFWLVLSGPNLFCENCDHSYSFNQFISEIHYPFVALPIIAIPSAIISIILNRKAKINPYYIFYAVNIITSFALIRVIW